MPAGGAARPAGAEEGAADGVGARADARKGMFPLPTGRLPLRADRFPLMAYSHLAPTGARLGRFPLALVPAYSTFPLRADRFPLAGDHGEVPRHADRRAQHIDLDAEPGPSGRPHCSVTAG